MTDTPRPDRTLEEIAEQLYRRITPYCPVCGSIQEVEETDNAMCPGCADAIAVILSSFSSLAKERDEAIQEHGKESGFWGRMAARAVQQRKDAEQERDALRKDVRSLRALSSIQARTREAIETPEPPGTHRCCGCGHKWDGPLKGAELCGDCWRKGQRVILGYDVENPPPCRRCGCPGMSHPSGDPAPKHRCACGACPGYEPVSRGEVPPSSTWGDIRHV